MYGKKLVGNKTADETSWWLKTPTALIALIAHIF